MDTIAVNDMLHDKFTKLDYTLVPVGYQGDVRSVRLVQECLSKVINTLGEQSAAAQGLTKVVTSADKLRLAPSHLVYLLKDANGKGGAGEVIGFLKVGRKHLYLYDAGGHVMEAEPMCVLDFFVLSGCQRHGHGRALFDHMLRDQQLQPHQLPVDGPSLRMEQFLKKNYGIQQLQRQSNNFAICPRFFDSVVDIRAAEDAAPAAAVGRFAAPPPVSHIANVIHGGGGHSYAKSNGGSRAPTPAASPAEWAAAPEPAPQPEPEAEPEPASPPQFVSPTRPATLRVQPQAAGERAAAGGPRRDSQLTDHGYFDVKFYHNKLW